MSVTEGDVGKITSERLGPAVPPTVQKAVEIAAQSHAVLQAFILLLIYILAFASRLFSVLRFESVIHEFDPYFNYRTTKFLIEEGFYEFHNWFDDTAWYPLGRIIGGTIYPGLMVTSAVVYWSLRFFHFTVDVRNVCVLLAPWMASNTTLVTYFLTKEVHTSRSGLIAAAMIAIVPGYISRSVAGSYDNEGVAIFAMVLTFFLWIRSVNTGSMLWASLCALSYFYMVSAWGGYVFLINIIPIHVFTLLVMGRYSRRLYVAYCTFYVLGLLLSMQIDFVGFQPVRSSEHIAAFGTFGLLQLYAGGHWVRSKIDSSEEFRVLLQHFAGVLVAAAAVLVMLLRALGYVSTWTGRFYSLLDPTYAKAHIPIIASVSEHQPTTWASFYFDLHILMFLFPVGMWYCFSTLNDANTFLILYGIFSVYFSGVMVRLMLVLAPIACILGAIAMTETLSAFYEITTHIPSKSNKKHLSRALPKQVAWVVVAGLTLLLCSFQLHCSWVTSETYSSPSIVLSAKSQDGSRIIFDDFREAYYWLRHNTPPDAKVMSWWDYGYQITAMANRTILVDNNTWNNTHIATVGRAMASTEDKAYEIMKQLDVDYVLVIFGGLTGYSSDDINKFLWMVRIGGGVYPDIKEGDYFTAAGDFKVDNTASTALLNSLMYKLCYYRFGQTMTEYGKPTGYDRVRHAEIGNKDFTLDHLDEAFSSEHWLVRIYKVKHDDNRP